MHDAVPKVYAELVALHMPRPINDDTELENTTEIVERLALLKRPNRDQRDYLELLNARMNIGRLRDFITVGRREFEEKLPAMAEAALASGSPQNNPVVP